MTKTLPFLTLAAFSTFAAFTTLSSAQTNPAIISIPVNIAHCTPGTPALLMWTGTTFGCAPIGSGLAIIGGVLTSTSTNNGNGGGNVPYSPTWQIETISLATVAPGATSITYTPSKTPLANVPIFWWYYASVVNLSTSGTAPSGSPLSITPLPAGWTAADTIVIAYQSQ